jgi:choloylglycine hydrolase
MCTAATLTTKDHYFGRNLDLEYSYSETVTVAPRKFPFHFRHVEDLTEHYALIGMAYVAGGFPLFYDATNEKGLSIAGLNFPQNAHFLPCKNEEGVDDIASFELIPWLLGQCATVAEARKLLARLNVCDDNFAEQLPANPLHWMLDDGTECVVIEPLAAGVRVYDNPVGVMTNNPTFDMQMMHLADYMGVNAGQGVNRFAPNVPLDCYSRGMGSLGLPGGLDSASRFVKVAFTKLNSVSADDESSSVSQFLHVLGSVCQQRGCCDLGDGKYEITIYSSCCNATKGIYYYTTYDNPQVSGVDMHHEDLDGTELAMYPLVEQQTFNMQN